MSDDLHSKRLAAIFRDSYFKGFTITWGQRDKRLESTTSDLAKSIPEYRQTEMARRWAYGRHLRNPELSDTKTISLRRK